MLYKIIICILLQLLGLSNCKEGPAGEPLLLSALIRQGEVEKALKLAEVKDISPSVLSYSGYITVNEERNSNLFFWFFPASAKNSDDAPVILWSEGGPGLTLLHSLFNLNGPYQFNSGKNLQLRNTSWTLDHNVIYLDNPVGVGFSFTDNEDGYPSSVLEASPNVYEFLTQFFKLFPNLKDNDFYNAGGSYGATYATSFAHYIHTKNQEVSADSQINLKGIILDSPWLHPVDQLDYGTFLFNLGLIDALEKEYFNSKHDQMVELIKEGRFKEASGIWRLHIMMDIPGFSGYNTLYNILNDQDILTVLYNYTDFVNQDSYRKAVHVGDKGFDFISVAIQSKMMPNFMTSVKPLLQDLLNAGYKTLVYVGNLDVITGHLGVQRLMDHLEWEGALDYSESRRQIWKSEGHIVGYVRSAKNLKHVLIRNAGHGCSTEQPDWVLRLVTSFIKGDEITELVNTPSIPMEDVMKYNRQKKQEL